MVVEVDCCSQSVTRSHQASGAKVLDTRRWVVVENSGARVPSRVDFGILSWYEVW